MKAKASIKESGEEISDAKWKRFEAAVSAEKDRQSSGGSETDKPYGDEYEGLNEAGQPTPEDRGDRKREREAPKTTKRTE